MDKFWGNLAEKKSTVTFPFSGDTMVGMMKLRSRNLLTSSKSPTNGLANRVRPAIDVAFTATRMTNVKPPKKRHRLSICEGEARPNSLGRTQLFSMDSTVPDHSYFLIATGLIDEFLSI